MEYNFPFIFPFSIHRNNERSKKGEWRAGRKRGEADNLENIWKMRNFGLLQFIWSELFEQILLKSQNVIFRKENW